MGFFGGGASVDLASPPAIGNTTPNTGAFTTLSANSTVSFSATGTRTAPTIQIRNANSGIYSPANGWIGFGVAGSSSVQVANNLLILAGNAALGWNSDTNDPSQIGSADLSLFRDGAANILAQRRSTNAQTFRIYNTFTDASNYERGFLRWSSNVLEIGAEAAGTGTARNLRLYGNVGIGTSSPGSPLCIEPSTAPLYGWMMKMLLSGLTANNSVGYILGRNESNYNLASIDFNYVGNNSTSNRISYGFYGVATPPVNILASGFVGIGTISPSTTFDINADKFRVRTAKTPASASAAGDQGDICWDSSYIYICTATNTWKRVAIATWP